MSMVDALEAQIAAARATTASLLSALVAELTAYRQSESSLEMLLGTEKQ